MVGAANATHMLTNARATAPAGARSARRARVFARADVAVRAAPTSTGRARDGRARGALAVTRERASAVDGKRRRSAQTIGAVANPLAVPTYDAPEGRDKNEPIRVKIGDEWYDCRGWAKAHPGGERWLYFFDGRDATDVFYALHSYGPNGSDLAVQRLKKLPRCDPPADKSRLPDEK